MGFFEKVVRKNICGDGYDAAVRADEIIEAHNESLRWNNEAFRWHDVSDNDFPDDCDYESLYVVTDGFDYYLSKFFGFGVYCMGYYEFPEGVWECNQHGIDVIAWKPIGRFDRG